MIKTALLDVTKIEPRLKHPTIFEHFDALQEGEQFTILNDHDPRPLYYQLLGERGNFFTWEYLENGPQWWRVSIAKPQAKAEETVGQIAAQDIRKADVFKKLGIDFCCGGKKTLQEAASSIGLSEKELQEKLAETLHESTQKSELAFNNWDIAFLSDYIKNVHHQYVRKFGPLIEELADKVAIHHGLQQPELNALANNIHVFMGNLYTHLKKEEEELFPMTKDLSSVSADKAKEVIDYLVKEHEDAGEELVEFRKLTQDYKLPTSACNSYIYLFERIKAFEEDLFQHIHLENNILFPKMISAFEDKIK